MRSELLVRREVLMRREVLVRRDVEGGITVGGITEGVIITERGVSAE